MASLSKETKSRHLYKTSKTHKKNIETTQSKKPTKIQVTPTEATTTSVDSKNKKNVATILLLQYRSPNDPQHSSAEVNK